MNRKNISQNMAWIRVAVYNVRPLLIKWAVSCSLVIVIYSGWLINNSVTNHHIQRSEQVVTLEPAGTSAQEKKPTIHVLKEDPALQAKPVDPATPPAVQPVPSPARPSTASNVGNPYASGNCTWYAKYRRPDLPNNLGNANTWTIRAQKQGIPTGTTPKAGAIAQKGMHVMYVEGVNPDGTMNISEMNFIGLGKISARTLGASGYQFIY